MSWLEFGIYVYLAIALVISFCITLYQIKNRKTAIEKLMSKHHISETVAFIVMILTCYVASLIWIVFVPIVLKFCLKCVYIVFKSIYRALIR